MRSILRGSRSLLRTSVASYSPSRRIGRLQKRDLAPLRGNPRTQKSLSSSATPPTPGDDNPPSNPSEEPEAAPQDEPEKPKRKTRAATAKEAEVDAPVLPAGLDILWTPETPAHEDHEHALPPSELLEEALTNLRITLHPQTQHRATYARPSCPLIEPTLAIYCPIEGGDYVIDETVRELATRTGSNVIVLDSVHLAAGEWGKFGSAAKVLKLPSNPLHFTPTPPVSPKSSRPSFITEDDDEPEFSFNTPAQMTLHVMAPSSSSRSRAYISAPPPSNSSFGSVKAFFELLINISSTESSMRRPRIVYVRDFATLAPSSVSWYPALLAAVRQRRQGSISRQTSPVANPTTIVFGVTPPIAASASPPSSGQGMMSILMNRNQMPAVPVSNSPQTSRSTWGEDDRSNKAREKRFKERMRKWEKGDAALAEEIPPLSSQTEDTSNSREDVVVVGGPGDISSLPPQLSSLLFGRPSRPSSASPESNKFFRTSILVPVARSTELEQTCRISRRKEINELTIRMAIGAIGGALSPREDVSTSAKPSQEMDAEPKSDAHAMVEEWGTKIETWPNVRQVADRALGQVVANEFTTGSKFTLDPTVVPWDAIYYAWAVHRSSNEIRKDWTKKTPSKTPREDLDEEDEESDEQESTEDETVKRIKNDPDLQPHESRLLSCIVDSASMPTSFSHVHLPPHTIDSVRTIVSLPLLHPSAFQQGILKEYGMSGCLLFGPPGTGKTLVVRALAKEAGCRMIAISPSDVMDMYVGEGEKLVKAVFSLARKLSPCVVFLDEIDALFGARMSARESGGAFAHRGVITEFMQEMDGLKSSKEDRVVIIGATNRPFDLDDAVLRRLPRRLLVDLPGEKEREEIIKILLRDEMLSPDLNLKILAKKTESFSGSDLKHLCVSAALDAVKERVVVPWNNAPPTTPVVEQGFGGSQPSVDPAPTKESSVTGSSIETPPTMAPDVRILATHNFTKALKEITPSSSESLGSLAELRKWNDEFGEGKKDKKRQVWGKGRFGFADKGQQSKAEEVRVVLPTGQSSTTGAI